MNSTNKIYHSNKCIVCYEDYEKTQTNECLLLKCGHVFHEKCIETWINEKQNCPICKSKAFVHIILKDIVTETVEKGIEGAKKSGKQIALVVSAVAVYAIMFGSLNYFFPGRWPTTEDELDASIEESGVLFDLRKPEGFIKLGLTITTEIAFCSTYNMIKSLIQRRNRIAETAKKINYTPPNQ